MKLKSYKWFRGLLKASALTSVMFVMQACYGSPNPKVSKQYDEASSKMDLIEKSVNSAKSCEDLEKLVPDFQAAASYNNDTTLTKEEKENLTNQLEELGKKIIAKAEEFGCE